MEPTPVPAPATGLESLRVRALECDACRLADRRRHVVFGEGDPTSPLVLVGEGPGDEEDRTGRPFVGRAGRLLDGALAAAGLHRSRVYICNTVKCRACDWSSGRPVNRPPADDEVAACRRWLVPQLAAIQPEVVLCVGAPSARNLIKRSFRITAERGRYFPCEFARTAIATLHPAYILRNQRADSDGGFSLLVADIAKAWEAAERLRSGAKERPACKSGRGQCGEVRPERDACLPQPRSPAERSAALAKAPNHRDESGECVEAVLRQLPLGL